MKNNISKPKEKKNGCEKKEVATQKLIGIDQPFDYDEVASVTGPEYIHNLGRDGIAVLPYEELKKNARGFNLLEDKCIWMKAGVINFRICDYDSDCYNCPFDRAIRSAMGKKAPLERKERQTNWTAQMKERYKIASKPCIHFMSGRIESPEECAGGYECFRCDVHRTLYPKKQVETSEKPKYTNVSGFQVAADYYHHIGHSWAHMEQDGWIRVGTDAFISKVFGPAEAINLPPVGAYLKQGEIGWVLSRDGLKAPMQSPVSGTVLAVNEKIKSQPEIVKDDPYETGWLFILDPTDLKLNLKGLYFGKECFQWIEKESQSLMKFMGDKYQRLAATGGELMDDIYGHLPETSWYRLVCDFLHTDIKP